MKTVTGTCTVNIKTMGNIESTRIFIYFLSVENNILNNDDARHEVEYLDIISFWTKWKCHVRVDDCTLKLN